MATPGEGGGWPFENESHQKLALEKQVDIHLTVGEILFGNVRKTRGFGESRAVWAFVIKT